MSTNSSINEYAQNVDIIIIGAGPAGMAAAIFAARAGDGLKIRIIERMRTPGLKLLATGGGHCNLTNVLSAEKMMEAFGRHGRFMRDAFNLLNPQGLRDFFAELGVKTHITDGFHVFPVSNSAVEVNDVLKSECLRLGVEFICNCQAENLIIAEKSDENVAKSQKICGITTSQGDFCAGAVILACGGKSYPKLGSDGSGLALAEQAGHTIKKPLPALSGLLCAEKWPKTLAGVVIEEVETSLDIKKLRKIKRHGALLFTHKGISGPAVLDFSGDVSEALENSEKSVGLLINLRPELSLNEWLSIFAEWRKESGAKKVRTLLAEYFPRALVENLLEFSGISADCLAAELSRAGQEKLIENLVSLRINVTDTEKFDSAMVTRGGVNLKEIDPKQLQSRLVSGLFMAGEMLDLDGPCGGYNLQWAFSSGALAGRSAAASFSNEKTTADNYDDYMPNHSEDKKTSTTSSPKRFDRGSSAD